MNGNVVNEMSDGSCSLLSVGGIVRLRRRAGRLYGGVIGLLDGFVEGLEARHDTVLAMKAVDWLGNGCLRRMCSSGWEDVRMAFLRHAGRGRLCLMMEECSVCMDRMMEELLPHGGEALLSRSAYGALLGRGFRKRFGYGRTRMRHAMVMLRAVRMFCEWVLTGRI